MFSWRTLPNRPLIIAHRGSSAVAPENTIAAFQLALEARADAIELDIRLTRDNHVVVIHDSHLRRTTNGKGHVKDYSLRELKELSAGAWFGRRFSSEKVPTLAQIFELSRGKIGINIEIKTERGKKQSNEIVKRCIALIHKHNASPYVLISSFHHPFIVEVKKLDRNIATGVLYHPVYHMRKSAYALIASTGADFFIVSKHSLRRKSTQDLHRNNIPIGVYSINTTRALNKILKMNVECIYTDNPSAILREVKLKEESNRE